MTAGISLIPGKSRRSWSAATVARSELFRALLRSTLCNSQPIRKLHRLQEMMKLLTHLVRIVVPGTAQRYRIRLSPGGHMKARTFLFAIVVALLAGCNSSAPPASADVNSRPAAPAFAEQALVEELVLANRILASKELGVLDSYGHISVRSKANPNHYYIARWVAPALVTLNDIIENG